MLPAARPHCKKLPLEVILLIVYREYRYFYLNLQKGHVISTDTILTAGPHSRHISYIYAINVG